LAQETLEEFKERVRKEYGPMYYNRQGKEMTLLEWGSKFEDMEYKIVKQDSVDRWFISTVWLGLNHALFRKQPPLIFETMIFVRDEDGSEKDTEDPLHLYQERYSTEEEAIVGHENAMAVCRAQLLIEERTRSLQSQVEGSEKDSQSADLDQLA